MYLLWNSPWAILCFVFLSLVSAASASGILSSINLARTKLSLNTQILLSRHNKGEPSLLQGRNNKGEPSFYRGFSGYFLTKTSSKMVYYYDLTILIEERDGGKLLNCEIIDVSNYDFEKAKKSITEAVGLPVNHIDMDKMVKIMQECQSLPVTPLSEFEIKGNATYTNDQITQLTKRDRYVFRILGTKWCGKGNTADNYYDLGTKIEVDKCCRTHDFCPSNIPPQTTRYNLANTDTYTKSHCTCDRNLRECLESTKANTAFMTEFIYFSLNHAQCFENNGTGRMEFKFLPKLSMQDLHIYVPLLL